MNGNTYSSPAARPGLITHFSTRSSLSVYVYPVMSNVGSNMTINGVSALFFTTYNYALTPGQNNFTIVITGGLTGVVKYYDIIVTYAGNTIFFISLKLFKITMSNKINSY